MAATWLAGPGPAADGAFVGAALAQSVGAAPVMPHAIPIPPRRPPAGAARAPRTDRTDIVEFLSGPFPFDDVIPGTGRPFFDVEENGRRGRRAAGGRIYWEVTYTDQRVLLHVPARFDVRRPGVIVVFFHGQGARIDHDVRDRQRVPEQLSNSLANAVLLAPQFALQAADSSAGNFWQPGSFARFLREGARQLAALYGDPQAAAAFANLPVVVVAYSGAFHATAWVLHHGGIGKRLRGIVLLDSLYGDLDKFESWITGDRSVFFVSAYLNSTRARNQELQRTLGEKKIPVATAMRRRLQPGSVVFIAGGSDENHTDFVTEAWVSHPITDLLNRLHQYRR
jgi:hypothetical protein